MNISPVSTVKGKTPGAGFTKIDFYYGLDIVGSQTSDRHLNQTIAQST